MVVRNSASYIYIYIWYFELLLFRYNVEIGDIILYWYHSCVSCNIFGFLKMVPLRCTALEASVNFSRRCDNIIWWRRRWIPSTILFCVVINKLYTGLCCWIHCNRMEKRLTTILQCELYYADITMILLFP